MSVQYGWLNERERRLPNVHNRLCLHVRRGENEQAELARKRLSTWFSDWDNPDDSDIRSRLNSEIDEQFISAAWELYVNSMLKRLGFAVTRLPQARSGTRPDFFVERHSHKFYVEASAIHPPKTAPQKIWNELVDKLSTLRRSDVMFGIWPEVTTHSSPKFSTLKHEINLFLDALDKQNEIHAFSGSEQQIIVGGWSFRLQAFQHLNPGTDTRAMVIYGYGCSGTINDLEDLRTKLEGKAGNYKNLEHPLVLAVLENSFVASSDHWHRMGALYGSEALLVSADEAHEAKSIRQRDGLWDPEYGDNKLSAIILQDRLNLLWPEMGQPSTWFNPLAEEDLSGSLLHKLNNFSLVASGVEEEKAQFEWNGI